MQTMTVTVTGGPGTGGPALGVIEVRVEDGQNWTDAIAAAYDDLGF